LAEPLAVTIQWRLDSWFADLGKPALDQLKKYFDELVKFNKSLSLVSTKTLAQADVLHFADSILASRIIREDAKDMTEIYDFGSGNGFPGLVFATIFPDVNVVLVDSDQRKCEFLKHCIAQMGLKNVTVRNEQVEGLEYDSIKYCMCRAFANISKAVMSARNCVSFEGVFYHMKGEAWSQEVAEIPSQLCSLWSPGLVKEYKLPIGAFKFAIVKTNKIA
jgi:16S rRNA (guanine527-N7)-methyltransferase